MADSWENKLYFGDNLDIMREHILDESIDLIYLDPPFNSKATYNVLFDEKNGTKSAAQIAAFEDTWHWGLESEAIYHEIVTQGSKKLAALTQALRQFLGQNDMMAYLVMMAIRLMEMHRVLKPTGNIYLHCDPTASHYLKLVMDAIFGARNFRNEIVWYYKTGGVSKRWFGRKHDILLFYSKTDSYKFNSLREKSYLTHKYGFSNVEIYQDEGGYYTLAAMRDVWDIPALRGNQPENLPYPTQKPEALLERVIQASSNEGDLVLDPFCGCGTTIAVAERLKRHWIGIDITYLAINLMKRRLWSTFKEELVPYQVIGVPKDLASAKALATTNRYQFEWWAVDLVGARPAKDKKKGADTGVDGYLFFFDDNSGQAKTLIVQVKSGHVSVSQIRDLKGVLEREKAVMGAFITLQEPTRAMREEAAAAGFYESEYFPGKRFPRIQILTIAELLSGQELQYPQMGAPATYKQAPRKSKGKEEQQRLI